MRILERERAVIHRCSVTSGESDANCETAPDRIINKIKTIVSVSTADTAGLVDGGGKHKFVVRNVCIERFTGNRRCVLPPGWARARLHRWALAGMVSYSVHEESGSGIQVGLVGNAHHGDEAPSADCLNHHVSHHLLLPHPSEDYYCQPVVGQAPRNICKIVCEERHRLARSVAASFTAALQYGKEGK